MDKSLKFEEASLVAQMVKNPPVMQETPILGLGRSPGERIGYPLQYSWASLVALMLKNLPAMGSTPELGRSLGGQPTLIFWPGESHG